MGSLKKYAAAVMALMLMFYSLPLAAVNVQASGTTPVLVFSDSQITALTSGSGYSMNGTTLTINAEGTYQLTGSCKEGSIVVKKGLENVVLIMDGLTLSSASTAPVVVKKGSSVTIHLNQTSVLTDNEDASTESSNEEFEGAAIKVKSGSDLTICGDGELDLYGNAKNAIKGASMSALTVNSGSIHVKSAANNGIAFDGSIVIQGGDFEIAAEGDGIKSVPDAEDLESAGSIAIHGGTFDLDVNGDGISADSDLTITNGTFDIKTMGGYQDKTFVSSTMSCKGLKASGNRENIEHSITIQGGSFSFDTADDAIHSDDYVSITGGTMYIYTGDDGVHADTQLDLGTENGNARDPEINIYASYEGLESGTVNAYSGKYWVTASDDWVNAAGGSTNGSDGSQSGDPFNPGGRGSGRSSGGGSFGPGGSSSGGQTGTTSTNSYSLNIYGGDFYVNCNGDGLDSNGNLNLKGGTATVLSQAQGGDNSPLDSDGTLLIDGAVVFAAGTNPMNESPASSSQKYTTSTTAYSAGSIINAVYNNSTVYTEALTKKTNYILYSSPAVSSNVTLKTGTIDTCKSNSWKHNWNQGNQKDDTTIVYTCQDCGATEFKSLAASVDASCSGHETSGSDSTDSGTENADSYTATLVTDGHATVDIYYTQDYTTASETEVTSAVARDASTGLVDVSGSGQINLKVTCEEGYVIRSVEVTKGSYNAVKNVDSGIYRITKIASDLTVEITTEEGTAEETQEELTEYTADFVTDGQATVDVFYTQDTTSASEKDVTTAIARDSATGVADISGSGQINFRVNCAEGYEIDGISIKGTYTNLKNISGTIYRITKITGNLTVTITTKASSSVEEAEDTSEGFTAAFVTDGTAEIDVYYTQDTTVASETNVTSAKARISSTGAIDVSGEGQINFKVTCKEGYEIEKVVVDGGYKNLKELGNGIYRITKITGNLTVTITTKASAADAGSEGGGSGNTGSEGGSAGSESGSVGSESGNTGNESGSTGSTKENANGEDGTALGTGASAAAAEKTILSSSATTDLSGRVFRKLCLHTGKVTKTSIKLQWKKLSKAVKYVVYGRKCKSTEAFTKLAVVKKNSYKQTKLKKATYYQYLLVALDKNNKVVSTSKIVFAATKGGTAGNPSSVKTKGGTKITLKKGKTFRLNGTMVTSAKKVVKYRAISYETSNTKIVKVSKKGVMKAKKKGSCYIYAYGQNGAYKKIKITVK